MFSWFGSGHSITRDTGHDYRNGTRAPGANAPLREINLPLIRPFSKLSNGAMHMQIDAAVSVIQRMEHGVI